MQRKVLSRLPKFPNVYNPGQLEVSTCRCQFLSFPQGSTLFSHIVSYASSLTLGFSGLFLFSLPLHIFPGGQHSSLDSPHLLALSAISLVPWTGPFKGHPVVVQVAPSIKNDHPSSCFNRCFLRPHPNVKYLVKSFQLCPLQTLFIWHYDVFTMTWSASLAQLRAFRAVLSCVSDPLKILIKI